MDLFQSNLEVKATCFPIYLLNLSIHQLFICHPILLSAPSRPPLTTFIPSILLYPSIPLILFNLNLFSVHNYPLSFPLLYSSPHYIYPFILCLLPCPPYSHPSHPAIHPTILSAFLTCIDPLHPSMPPVPSVPSCVSLLLKSSAGHR